MIEIDQSAKEKAIRYGMPPDVHIPISARNIESIIKYIGTITQIDKISIDKAFIVSPSFLPELNPKLPLWKIRESSILHKNKQMWVHVDYNNYRKAYLKSFPEEDISGYFLDHIANRRVSRLKGFNYIRLIPVYPAVNTSSGSVTEKYGYEYHNSVQVRNIDQENGPFIEYADLADLVKMLNMKTGGMLQNIVNESQSLIKEE